MPHKPSRRIVIDASVARASGGEDATYPLPKNCRDFLKTILIVCHQVVMSPDIVMEWRKHESNWARTWRASMVARKKMYVVRPPNDLILREQMRNSSMNEKQGEAMIKDCHLVEAAIATDRCIASLDEAARSLFGVASHSIIQLMDITWINPGDVSEEPIEWLKQGAAPEKSRQLGFKTPRAD
jgi:hypothetical protein